MTLSIYQVICDLTMMNDHSGANGLVVTKDLLASTIVNGTSNCISTFDLILAKAAAAPLHAWTLSIDIVSAHSIPDRLDLILGSTVRSEGGAECAKHQQPLTDDRMSIKPEDAAWRPEPSSPKLVRFDGGGGGGSCVSSGSETLTAIIFDPSVDSI